eukprot:scaffold2878_cov111-Isochrysis_galbana.AAC.3
MGPVTRGREDENTEGPRTQKYGSRWQRRPGAGISQRNVSKLGAESSRGAGEGKARRAGESAQPAVVSPAG